MWYIDGVSSLVTVDDLERIPYDAAGVDDTGLLIGEGGFVEFDWR